ncbi:MAG TPA: 50S ribosomal protein L15 [Opitutales bacterium]|nr:50S ribosomal protein L15 [Opitutales bacterium]
MELHNLKNVEGAVRRRKRVGTGIGSGRGRTCGRGQKGQKSRGGKQPFPGFEGGQMPLYRKLPRRGFNNKNFRTDYAIVNLSDLSRIEGTTEIDRQVLVDHGLIRANAGLIKVLGDGEIQSALTITADKFSASARSKIEAAGGTVNIVEPGEESVVSS